MSTPDGVPYVASERKRFEISHDPYSRARVKLLRDFYLDINAKWPGLLAITLFGSLTKGKVLDVDSAPKTDIDFYMFIDEDVATTVVDSDSDFQNIDKKDRFKKLKSEVIAQVLTRLDQSQDITLFDFEEFEDWKERHIIPRRISLHGEFSILDKIDHLMAICNNSNVSFRRFLKKPEYIFVGKPNIRIK